MPVALQPQHLALVSTRAGGGTCPPAAADSRMAGRTQQGLGSLAGHLGSVRGSSIALTYPLLAQGRHRSDRAINNRPCQILVGKR